MPTYRVICTGQVTETYLVDADNEDEARNNWHEGELLMSEAWDVLPDSVTEEDD